MGFEERLQIPGDIAHVGAACAFVVKLAQRAGLNEQAVNHCELAVDEACTNIIEHGYRYQGADQVIDVICRHDKRGFSIVVCDDSPAFDPLLVAEPDPTADLEARQPGGWGVYFIKRVMDEVFYRYEGRRNCLYMVKRLDDTAPDTRPRTINGQITVQKSGSRAHIITIEGRLDQALLPRLEQVVTQQLAAGYKCLVIDMQQVETIASGGLRMVMRLVQQVQVNDGALVLANLRPPVRAVFNMAGLDLVLAIYPTREAAVASFE